MRMSAPQTHEHAHRFFAAVRESQPPAPRRGEGMSACGRTLPFRIFSGQQYVQRAQQLRAALRPSVQ